MILVGLQRIEEFLLLPELKNEAHKQPDDPQNIALRIADASVTFTAGKGPYEDELVDNPHHKSSFQILKSKLDLQKVDIADESVKYELNQRPEAEGIQEIIIRNEEQCKEWKSSYHTN
ncbi:MAG: hypothetical protein EZS28_041867 [Streblomastix strix]|uniref:Uncharacterized protein n=1 Tax=Streblomastix strix TaxID=222440 RepID=A0A5J4TVV5_9EUKA|nr:MAG: hypothetical protein EZS28_041867 [Streblomastix strix]